MGACRAEDPAPCDMNEFAHGKGETQFMNLAFNLNPIIALTVPYSILGSGLVLLPTEDLKQAIVSFFFRSSTGKASTGGFDDLNDDNSTFASEGRVIANLPGLTISLIGEFLNQNSLLRHREAMEGACHQMRVCGRILV
jgi:hypothetical protein